jgi:predicted DsbA family dithiol-disulfide isomerase
MIRLDIFSDPVCPWCYIGKANLDRALEAHPDHPFAVHWHPFQLNPNQAPEGVKRRDYLVAKFGGSGPVDAMNARLREAAKAVGLVMEPETPLLAPNTLNAHRLTHWAEQEGAQSLVVAALFRAYWQDGLDIGNPSVLADIAASCGMDGEMTLQLLHSDADADDIQARDLDARNKGVTAVPTFLIAQQYVVSGAQPPDVWHNIISELTEIAKAE